MVADPGANIPGWVETYESGLAAFEDRRWREAMGLFEATAGFRGGLDRPSEILIQRCRACVADPPPEDRLWTSAQE
jgi:hypothetical protein